MKTIKGPAIFLAQFAGNEAPFDNLDNIAAWAAGLGFKGVQIPSWDSRLFDLRQASESKSSCEDIPDARPARSRRDGAVDAPAGPARGRAPGL